MFPRSAHSSLRLALWLAVTAHPACSVYDSSLTASEDAGSSAAAASAGGELTGGAANGGAAGLAGGGASAGGASGGAAGNAATGGTSNAGAMNGGAAGNGGAGAGGASGGAAGKGGAGAAGSSGAAGGSGAPGIDPCSRSNWTASASESSLTMTPPQLYDPPPDAIDGDGNTRWASGAAQVGGEWFSIDLGAVAAHLTQIVLDTTVHPTDFPANYKLELSSDGAAYTSVATGSGSSITTIKFSDRPARYVKLTQTGTSTSWWSIHELSISCQSN
jgi:hypothetical protein